MKLKYRKSFATDLLQASMQQFDTAGLRDKFEHMENQGKELIKILYSKMEGGDRIEPGRTG